MTGEDLSGLLTREGLTALLELDPDTRRQVAAEYADDLTALLTKTKADERAVRDGYRVDLARALDFADFCRTFVRHSKGRWAGRPFELCAWQWALVLSLFGWVHRETGLRRFRRLYLELPKKNGKSTLAAAIALFLLVADGEPGSEVYCAAKGRDQARIVFREVENTVRRSAALRHLRVYRASSRILDEGASAFLAAVSADVGLQEGINAHGVVFDELHVQKTRDLWDALVGSGASRLQPLFVAITTAGDEESELCWEQHEYAEGIARGDNDDPSFLGIVFGAKRPPGSLEDWWDDPAVWAAANPSLGETITLEGLEELAAKARVSRGARVNFLRRHLNVWGSSAARWLDLARWDACKDSELLDRLEAAWRLTREVEERVEAGEDPGVDREILEEAYRAIEGLVPGPGGLDLASTIDLVGYVRVFGLPDGRLAVRARGWTTDATAARREAENKHRYGMWLEEGVLESAGGEVVAPDVVKTAVVEDYQAGLLTELGIDPWGTGVYLADEIEKGEGVPTVLVRQGTQTMNAPMKRLEELILEKRIVHDGHPALRWCLGNLVVSVDPKGNVAPNRRRSPEKIDLAVAFIMAIARWQDPEGAGDSVYEERGPMFF